MSASCLKRDAPRCKATIARLSPLTTIASAARAVEGANTHRLSARVYRHETPAVAVNAIVDRIGTGDVFAAGLLMRLYDECEIAAAVHARQLHRAVHNRSVQTRLRDLISQIPIAGQV